MAENVQLEKLVEVLVRDGHFGGSEQRTHVEDLSEFERATLAQMRTLLAIAGAECAEIDVASRLPFDLRKRILTEAIGSYRDRFRRFNRWQWALAALVGAAAASVVFVLLRASFGDRDLLAQRGAVDQPFAGHAMLWVDGDGAQTIELEAEATDALLVVTASRDSFLFVYRINTDVGVEDLTAEWKSQQAAIPMLMPVRTSPLNLTAEAFVAVYADENVSPDNRTSVKKAARKYLEERYLELLMPPGDESIARSLEQLQGQLQLELSPGSDGAIRIAFCQWFSSP